MRRVLAAGAIAACFGLGCNSAHSYDCNEACNLYADCIYADYDTKTCETTCESKSGSDSSYGMRATACHDCLAASACVDAGAFDCAPMCTGIVP